MGEFFEDLTRDLREIRRAAEDAVIPLRDVNALSANADLGSSGGPAIVGFNRNAGVFGSGRKSLRSLGGEDAKFKDVREIGGIAQDLVSGNYAGAITSITKEVAKKFGVSRSGVAAGGAIFIATSAVATAFDRAADTNRTAGQSEVAVSLRPLQDLGGRRASAKNAEELIQKELDKQIGQLKGLDRNINRTVGQEGVFREIAETGSSFLNKLSFGIIPAMTSRKELREKSTEETERIAAKAAAAVQAGYAAIGLGNLAAGAASLKEANSFDPNISRMWYRPGSIYMGMESARIAGATFSASRMKRAGPRIGD